MYKEKYCNMLRKVFRHADADPGIYVMGALYWRGIWGPPTGHAYLYLKDPNDCHKM